MLRERREKRKKENHSGDKLLQVYVNIKVSVRRCFKRYQMRDRFEVFHNLSYFIIIFVFYSMLLVLVVVSALLHFHVPGFADGTSDHVDVHPADMYLRGVEESRNLEGLERHKRQSNDLEFREMFVTQCGYSVLEPEGEPSINIKGIGLNNWNAIEKVRTSFCSYARPAQRFGN